MTEEMSPCPFCGGEATIRREDDMWIVECRHHGWSSKDDDGCSYAGDISLYVEISGKVNHWTHEIEYAEKDIDLAKKKAIEAWNRRAERTCRVEEDTKRASQTQLVVTKSCSECGHCFGAETHYERIFEGLVLNEIELPRYCPNCGARVIEEES